MEYFLYGIFSIKNVDLIQFFQQIKVTLKVNYFKLWTLKKPFILPLQVVNKLIFHNNYVPAEKEAFY